MVDFVVTHDLQRFNVWWFLALCFIWLNQHGLDYVFLSLRDALCGNGSMTPNTSIATVYQALL